MQIKPVTSAEMAAPAGHYSPALVVSDCRHWLVLSGQVAVDRDGKTPEGVAAQTVLIWRNIRHLLDAADMQLSNIVKVTSYLTLSSLLGDFNTARAGILGDHKPASTLLIVSGLAAPQYLVEIEVVAAK